MPRRLHSRRPPPAGNAVGPSPAPLRRHRLPRLLVLALAAAVAVVVTLIATDTLGGGGAPKSAPPQTANGRFNNPPPFKATVAIQDRSGRVARIEQLAYRDSRRWRHDIVATPGHLRPHRSTAPPPARGSFTVVDGRLKGDYEARSGLFTVLPLSEAEGPNHKLDGPATLLDPGRYSTASGTISERSCRREPDAQVAGRPVLVLACDVGARFPVWAWIDKQTSALLRYRSPSNAFEVTAMRFGTAPSAQELRVRTPAGATPRWQGTASPPAPFRRTVEPGATTIAVGGITRALTAAFGSVWISAYENRRATIRRLDPVTNAIAGRAIPAGTNGLAAGFGALWAIDQPRGRLHRIDPITERVTATVSLPPLPGRVAIGAGAVWVALPTESPPGVARVDAARARLERVIELPREGRPQFVAVSHGAVWATDARSRLYRIDPRTGRIVARINTPPAPLGVAGGAGAIWVVTSPYGASVGESSFAASVSGYDPREPTWLLRVDPRTNRITGRLRLARPALDVTVTGTTVLVTDPAYGTLTVVDARTVRRLAPPRFVGSGAFGGVTAGFGSVWVAGGNDGTIVRLPLRRIRARE